MAVLEIPIQNNLVAFKETVTIEGVVYVLAFYFNQRMNLWLIDILDEFESPQLVGIPIQTNVPLTINFKHLTIPPGLFLPFDIQGQSLDADINSLGVQVKLLYEELANA